MKLPADDRLKLIHNDIIETYELHGGINQVDGVNLPSRVEMVDVIKKVMHLLFPGYFSLERIRSGNLKSWSAYNLDQIFYRLKLQIERSLCATRHEMSHAEHVEKAEQVTLAVLAQIPRIRGMLKKDVKAAYMGDPAAESQEEIIMSYPAVLAIACHRFAHELYQRKVPFLPRMISEYAHGKTGIDIHPGAKIGESFFIDHGTGVVVGETCEIGDRVKIYQGVTLGALSFRKDESGALAKKYKRHPTIQDEVILYAGCNILGGETVIGRGSVIGGNVWITESVEPYTVITFDVTKQEYRRFKKDEALDSDLFKGFGI